MTSVVVHHARLAWTGARALVAVADSAGHPELVPPLHALVTEFEPLIPRY